MKEIKYKGKVWFINKHNVIFRTEKDKALHFLGYESIKFPSFKIEQEIKEILGLRCY